MPRLTEDYHVIFYGGEPVLNLEVIERTVHFLISETAEFKKRPHFSITTNGSLLSEEKIRFLDKHVFSVELSFDGLAQGMSRDRASTNKVIRTITRLLESQNIRLEINSVFDAKSVEEISESIAFIMGLGVRNVNLSLSILKPWDERSLNKLEQEIAKLSRLQWDHYETTGEISLLNFRDDDQKGIFYCSAGQDRFAVSPDGKLWGCALFADYFKDRENSSLYEKYCFGDIGHLGEKPENVFKKIRLNYSRLSMDQFSTKAMDCFLCPDLQNCAVCPMDVSFAGHSWNAIPDYVCTIQKIKIREKEKFLRLK